MALSVSSAYIPPAALSLTPSDQKLVPQAPTDPTRQAMANAAPAAIYHPSEPTQTTQEPLEVIDTWVGRSQSPEFPRFVEQFTGAQSALKASFKTFEAALATTAPDLARTDYSFTVESDGRLKVLDKAGQLSDANVQRLTELLNHSTDLKAAAVAYRNAAIDMVDADSPWSGSYLGYHSLTNENFAKTIDLAPLLREFAPSDLKGAKDRFFVTQLAYKGERATEETERAMFERRAGQA
ncbi:MAG TPA: hypothetical protein K8W20_24820 [Pseudomonas lactis]|uniref:Uncharacterized protein n=1 Tax=Pseudomonas lactis TaxID=1615674 RepID=A0A921TA29_9PSED|nr:hypothetical protein [Pseudomonas lactis]HJH21916.1 hypothetical protein [Pseudomonas lactis]